MTPDNILKFWLDDIGEKGWYEADVELDTKIKERFYQSWIDLCDGSFGLWLTYPNGALAYIILADQFSRNMFRGQKNAFATDRMGVAAAKSAIKRGWDRRIDEPARQFFYLPLMHSENLSDQDRCVRLVLERMPQTGSSTLDHAKAHREVIREFGRFPYRNDALERTYTNAEREYLAKGGYGFTVQKFLKTT